MAHLAFHPFVMVLQRNIHCGCDPFLNHAVIILGRKREADLMPNEACARNLLEDAGRGLKDNGVRESHHPAAGLGICPAAAEFEQMESDESYVDHFSGHAGDLHPIPNSNSVFSDQEEIACDGQDYVLQRNRHSGREKTREREPRIPIR